MDKNPTHNTASYVLVISHEEIEKSDGYLEHHTCGYPIYWAYNIKPDDGVSEYEYWEPVDIVKNSSEIGKQLDACPQCKKKLEIRQSGNYEDLEAAKEALSELVNEYCHNGDSVEFKTMLEEAGMRLGII